MRRQRGGDDWLKDLIDRKAVLKIVNDELEYSDNIYATSVCITIRRAVECLPSARPSRIHCYECKHYDTQECMGRNAFYGLKDDDYCSWAERKKEVYA